MAGHSKWANIQHRKGRQDERKGALFSRTAREIIVAAKLGGGDIQFNPRLRMAVDKAKSYNMPKDKIENAIKKGTSELEGVTYEEIRYEGYSPGGAAIMIDCLTDSKTRAVSEVRHALNKHGGNLGTDGCVSYLFEHCGQFLFSKEADEEQLIEAACSIGAQDIKTHEDSFEVLCSPQDFLEVKEGFEKHQILPESAEIIMRPTNETHLTDSDAESTQKLLDALNNLDDVQNIYTTASF